MDYIDFILITILFVSTLAIGWFSNELYDDFTNKRVINGLWIDYDNSTRVQALEIAKQYDSKGDWICTNIRGISMKEVIRTCEHESAHELFARQCENDVTKCMDSLNYSDGE